MVGRNDPSQSFGEVLSIIKLRGNDKLASLVDVSEQLAFSHAGESFGEAASTDYAMPRILSALRFEARWYNHLASLINETEQSVNHDSSQTFRKLRDKRILGLDCQVAAAIDVPPLSILRQRGGPSFVKIGRLNDIVWDLIDSDNELALTVDETSLSFSFYVSKPFAEVACPLKTRTYDDFASLVDEAHNAIVGMIVCLPYTNSRAAFVKITDLYGSPRQLIKADYQPSSFIYESYSARTRY